MAINAFIATYDNYKQQTVHIHLSSRINLKCPVLDQNHSDGSWMLLPPEQSRDRAMLELLNHQETMLPHICGSLWGSEWENVFFCVLCVLWFFSNHKSEFFLHVCFMCFMCFMCFSPLVYQQFFIKNHIWLVIRQRMSKCVCLCFLCLFVFFFIPIF